MRSRLSVVVPWPAAFLAGKAYLDYRRRGGGLVLPDFFVGAHAAVEGMRGLGPARDDLDLLRADAQVTTTSTAVTRTFRVASGNRIFQPSVISWS